MGEGQAGVEEQGMASQGMGSPRALVKLPVGGDDCDDDDCDAGGVVRMMRRTFRCCSKELYTIMGRSAALSLSSSAAAACSSPSAPTVGADAGGMSTQPVNALNCTAATASASGACVITLKQRAKSAEAIVDASASCVR